MIIGPGRGKMLADLVREHQPKRLLEIGTNIGYSAILMGKELGSDTHIITIEIDSGNAQRARENIHRAAIKPKVEVKLGDARDVLPTLEGEFDFVFIDAAKDQYWTYLQLIEEKLHTGTIIVADNVGRFADQMQDYLEHVRSSGKYESRYVEADYDAVEISVLL